MNAPNTRGRRPSRRPWPSSPASSWPRPPAAATMTASSSSCLPAASRETSTSTGTTAASSGRRRHACPRGYCVLVDSHSRFRYSVSGTPTSHTPLSEIPQQGTGTWTAHVDSIWPSFWTCVGDHFFLNSKRTRQRVVYDLREKGGFSVFKVETTFMGRLVVKI